jgi:hypothetical protein
MMTHCARQAVTPNKSKAIPYRPKRAALNWVDYLVIAATVLTFLVVVAANDPHAARAMGRATANIIPAYQLPEQTSQLGGDAGLIKARIGLAMGRPWS